MENDNTLIKVTVDIPKRVADVISLEGKDNKRSRKAQVEFILERHAEKLERKAEAVNG